MSQMNVTPPGWYYAEGDPPGTQRYWDGSTWQGGPQPVAFSGPASNIPEGRLAEPGKRILARIIDVIVWLVIGSVVSAVFGVGLNNVQDLGSIIGLSLVAGLVSAVAVIGYEAIMLGSRGQTLGKMALGIRVVRADGAPVEVVDGIKRTALYLTNVVPIVGPFIAVLLGLISSVMIFSDHKNQALWDRVANTIVVDA